MKKITSVFLSLMFIITTISIGSITAFAETTSKYWEPRPHPQDTASYVNGKANYDDFIGGCDENGVEIIEYIGKGHVIKWEFPLAEENIDYKIISQENNKITIMYPETNKNRELAYINAVVDFDETSSQTTQTEQQTESTSSTSVSKTQETTTNATAEKNDNLNTVKILIPALAVVCIAVIVIIAIKKHKK